MSDLERRVARLEGGEPSGLMVVTIKGGLPDDDMTRAAAGTRRWLREAGETVEAFQDRVRMAAQAAGEPVLVLGGLPDDE